MKKNLFYSLMALFVVLLHPVDKKKSFRTTEQKSMLLLLSLYRLL